MKKIITFSFLSAGLFFSNRSSAQYLMGGAKADSTLPKIEFGLKIGTNIQSITGATWDNSYKPGIVGGIVVGMHKNKVGVRLEILANTSRYTAKTLADSLGNKGDFRAIYLDVPLLFEYRVTPKLLLLAGPQYSNMLSINSVNGFLGDVKTLFKQAEISGLVGTEWKLPKNILVGARFIYGFTNLNNGPVSYSDETWSNRTIQLYAGYTIR